MALTDFLQIIFLLKTETNLKFGTVKRENMYLPHIRVKFSDRYKTSRDTTKKQITSAECRGAL